MAKNIKAGARHSTSDTEHGDQAVSHLQAAGFMHPDEREKAKADATKSTLAWAAKCYAMGPTAYAIEEAWDIIQATGALQSLAALASGELSEMMGADTDSDAAGDLLDLKQLAALMRGLLKFISGEVDEMELKAQPAPTGDAPADLPNIATPEAVAASMGKSAGLAAPAWNVHYLKSLKLTGDQERFKDLLAVKFIGKDTIRAYSMLWGDPDLVDVETDFFTKSTDFWDARLALPKPLTYEHGQEDATKSISAIGSIVEFGDDDIGRWFEAQVDRNHQYRKAIGKLISARALGASSDSAPQYVIAEPAGKSAHWLKQWPWFATSLTTTPAEPRMLDAGALYWKSAGLAQRLASFAEQPQQAVGDLARVEELKRSYALLALDAS